jgi:hypothetical protein
LPWARCPLAASLVAQLADPDRWWDAIVIGEYERASYASQYASMAPLFEHYGIGLWMPEVGGRVDWHAEDHEQTMSCAAGWRPPPATPGRLRPGLGGARARPGRFSSSVSACCRTAQADPCGAGRDAAAVAARAWLVMSPAR